jgi:hypothetical protein
VSDIDTVLVASLKALDPERPPLQCRDPSCEAVQTRAKVRWCRLICPVTEWYSRPTLRMAFGFLILHVTNWKAHH